MCLTPSIPLTLRVYSAEDTWPTLFANERGGQNRQSVLVRKDKPRKPKKHMVATAVLDRCGNNWRNTARGGMWNTNDGGGLAMYGNYVSSICTKGVYLNGTKAI